MNSLLAAVLLTGCTLGISAPTAHAAAVTADCGFNTIAQEQVTGGQDTFTGGAYGYAVADTAGSSISVTCEVRVNGGTVASTPAGAAGQASVTGGQVTFTAGDTDTVTLCAVWTGSESGEICGAATTQQVPPQEAIDLLDSLILAISSASGAVDPAVCPVFAALSPGVPGVIDIASDGDVFVAADLFWDCPPYGSSGSTGEGAIICVEWQAPLCHPPVHPAPCHIPPPTTC